MRELLTPLVADLLSRCTFPPAGRAVSCAVSGGADSSALLVLARAAGLEVTAVHVDHGLRPESHEEAAHVRRLAGRFGATMEGHRVNLDDGPNLEERARRARRDVIGPDALTGHTADDQAETILINLIRGAGPDGLAGMVPGPTHPILALRRSETVALCDELSITPVVDDSNVSPRFVRNRIRHEVLPLLADISQRDVVPLLNRTADVARESVAALDALATHLDPTDTTQLAAAAPALAARSLRQWLTDGDGHPPSRADLERVMTVVRRDAVACQITGGREIRRTEGRLRMEPIRTEPGFVDPTTDESAEIVVDDASAAVP